MSAPLIVYVGLDGHIVHQDENVFPYDHLLELFQGLVCCSEFQPIDVVLEISL